MANEEPFFPSKMPIEELTLLSDMSNEIISPESRRVVFNELKRREDARVAREEAMANAAKLSVKYAMYAAVIAAISAIIAAISAIFAAKPDIVKLIFG